MIKKMQSVVEIRKARMSDCNSIVEFQEKMAWETEYYKLDHDTVQRGVEAVLNNENLGLYFLAIVNDEVAGSLLTTYEWSDWRNGIVLWIQSVYVDPEYRKRGIYRALYNHIKSLVIKDESLKGIRLYVDKSNKNAHKVYSRLGMDGNHYRVFEWMPSDC
jgi:GNAT superfamily N-acetyltransferase